MLPDIEQKMLVSALIIAVWGRREPGFKGALQQQALEGRDDLVLIALIVEQVDLCIRTHVRHY
jgi:hypothetical protein